MSQIAILAGHLRFLALCTGNVPDASVTSPVASRRLRRQPATTHRVDYATPRPTLSVGSASQADA